MRRVAALSAAVIINMSPLQSGEAQSQLNPEHTFTIREENGVRIAESGGGPKYEGDIFTFEEIFELDQDESRPEALLNMATGYLMDEDGLIFVFDMGDCRVAVFDNNGKYLRDFGREGAGPGEFSHIQPQWIRDGIIAVYDPFQYRASTLTTDGWFLNFYIRPGTSNRRLFAPIMRSLRSIFPLPDGRMVQIFQEQMQYRTVEEAKRTAAVLVSSAGDSSQFFSTEWMATPRSPRRGGGLIYHQKMYFAEPALQVDLDRGVFIADPREPNARWYDLDGNLSHILRLGLEPEPVTSEEKGAFDRFYRELIREAEGPEKERREEVLKHMIIPNHKPFWKTILVDDQGFYWLRNHEDWTQPAEVRRLWSFKIFSPEGEHLGSATWPTGNISSITRGHLLGRKMDEEFGGYRHFVYRITPAIEGLEYPR